MVASLILLLAWVFSSATAIVIACVWAYCGYWWSYTVHTLPLLALAATLFRVVVGPPLDHVVDQVPWLRLDDTRLWRVLCGVSAAAVPLFAVFVRVPPVLLALLAAAKILIPFLRWLCYALAFVIIPGSLYVPGGLSQRALWLVSCAVCSRAQAGFQPQLPTVVQTRFHCYGAELDLGV